MRILAIRSNKIRRYYRTIHLAAALRPQLSNDRVARVDYRNAQDVVRTPVERLATLVVRFLFRLIAKPAKTKTKVVKVAVCLLPETLRLPVGQHNELPATTVLQAIRQSYCKVLNRLGQFLYRPCLKAAQTHIRGVSGIHEISAVLNTERFQALHKRGDVNTVS